MGPLKVCEQVPLAPGALRVEIRRSGGSLEANSLGTQKVELRGEAVGGLLNPGS